MPLDATYPRQYSLSWPSFLCLAGLGLVALFTLLNPEPSRSLNVVQRAVFWLLHVGGLLGLMQGAQLLISSSAPARTLGFWPQVFLAGVIGSLIFAPLGLQLDYIFGLATAADDLASSWHFSVFDDFAAIAPAATLTWVGLNATRRLRVPAVLDPHLNSGPSAPQRDENANQSIAAGAGSSPAADAQASAPTFWSRVPASLGRDLIALTAELHYLRVVTAKGNALIHYPFGQAVSELAAANERGAQIHRSHWVALSHVASFRREGDRAFCVMDNGATLPVGRRRQAAVVKRLSGDPSRNEGQMRSGA